MFKSIGGKIKVLATVVAWLGIVASVIGGIAYMTIDFEDLFFQGFIIAVAGSIVSWISSFVLYGFGELVENSGIIAQKQVVTIAKSKSPTTTAPETQIKKESQQRTNGKCQLCGAENVELSAVKIEDDLGIRYRNVCDGCFEKYNCKSE